MPVSIPDVMAKLPAAFTPEKSAGLEAVVHFKFTGSEPGEWNAVIRNGKCDVAQGIPHSKPTITLNADSSDFLSLIEGELEPMQAVMQGKLKFNGDPELALRLLGTFRRP